MKNTVFRVVAATLSLLCIASALCACNKEPQQPQPPTTTTTTAKHFSSDMSDIETSGSSDWAYSLYTEALEESEKHTGQDISLTGTCTIKSKSDEETRQLNMTLRSEEQKKDVFIDHLIVNNSTNYLENKYEVYYADGIKYYSDKKEKYKQTIDRNTAMPELALFKAPVLTQASFSSPAIAYENGLTKILLPMLPDILYSQLITADSSFAYLIGGLQSEAEYTINTVTAELSFDDKNQLCIFSIFYEIAVESADPSIVSVRLDMTYNHPNTDIQIKLPKLSGYKEMYSSVLGGKAYEAMPTIVDTLFDDNGNRIKEFKTQYTVLCKKYTKSIVDSVISWFEKQ